MKTCNVCKATKQLDEFHLDRSVPDGRQRTCKPCSIARSAARNRERRPEIREWQRRNPDSTRASYLRYRYGIDVHQYDALLNAQSGRCALCGAQEPGGRGARFHVDHDHETGHVRGLLCHRCNTGLGMLGDDLEGVRAALRYLERAMEPGLSEAPAAHGA